MEELLYKSFAEYAELKSITDKYVYFLERVGEIDVRKISGRKFVYMSEKSKNWTKTK